MPKSFQRARAPASFTAASWRADGATRPLRLSFSLASSESPGNVPGSPVPLLCSPDADTLPGPIARTSAAAVSAAAPASVRDGVRTVLHLLDGSFSVDGLCRGSSLGRVL